jgi:hypothetical protein
MRVEARAVAALLSVLLHLLIVSALVRVAKDAAEPPPPAQWEVTADRLRGAGEKVIRIELRPGLSESDLACSDSSYIGVGITADPRTERIILVGENTPASRAGLQHDDIVLNPGVWRDARQEGALLRLLVLREGVGTMAASVRVGRICIE